MKRVRMVIGIASALLIVAAGVAMASGGTEAGAKQEPLVIKWFSIRSFPKEGTEIPPKLEALVSSKVGFPVKFTLMGGVEDAELHATVDKLLAANDLPDKFQRMNIDTKFLEQAAAKFSVQMYKENMPGQYKWLLSLGTSLGKTEAQTWSTYQDPKDQMMWGEPRIWDTGWVPSGQMWRKDLLDQLGYKIPTTLAETEKVYEAYKSVFPTKYATTGRGATNWQCFSAVFNAYGLPGGDAIVRNGKIVQDFTTREFREAIQVLTRWYAKGYWDPNYMKHNLEWAYNFAEGNYIGPLVWTKDWNYMDKTPPTSYLEKLRNVPGAVAVAAPHLRADKNVKAAQIVWDPFLTQLAVYGKHLEKDQAKMAKIMKVSDLFSVDREVRLLSGYGIEGVHYTIPAGEKAPVMTDLVKSLGTREHSDKYGYGAYWSMLESAETWLPSALVKMYNDYVTAPGAMYNQSNLKYHYIGGTVRGAVTDEAGQPVQVTMKSDWFTMVVEIMTGKRPIEYYDEWLQAYYDGGGKAWETHANRLWLKTSVNN
jgi:ABC-type glycerol-3-phosphate transport system substrate-binding protein